MEWSYHLSLGALSCTPPAARRVSLPSVRGGPATGRDSNSAQINTGSEYEDWCSVYHRYFPKKTIQAPGNPPTDDSLRPWHSSADVMAWRVLDAGGEYAINSVRGLFSTAWRTWPQRQSTSGFCSQQTALCALHAMPVSRLVYHGAPPTTIRSYRTFIGVRVGGTLCRIRRFVRRV